MGETKEEAAEREFAARDLAQRQAEDRATRVNKANRRNGAIAAGLGVLLLLAALWAVAAGTGGGALAVPGLVLVVLGAYYLGKRVKPDSF